MIRKLIFAGFVVSFVFVSCRDESDPAPEPTRTQILTSRRWKITAAEIDGKPETLGACYGDDEITFFEDGELRIRFNAIKCDGSSLNTSVLTWEFKNNDTKIVWKIGVDETEFVILELTYDIFQIESHDGGVHQILTFEPTEE